MTVAKSKAAAEEATEREAEAVAEEAAPEEASARNVVAFYDDDGNYVGTDGMEYPSEADATEALKAAKLAEAPNPKVTTAEAIEAKRADEGA